MASTINLSIDPVSRIEGHLRVDLEITDGMVASARSSGTSFRGFEGILIGRDPRDAAHITQRICGVCPVPHARNSSEAFEAAAGLKVSAQAVNIRNVIQAANFIESHILHFYVLSLPDYVAGLPTAGMWPQGKAPRVWKDGAELDSLDWNAAAYEAISIVHACHELATIFGGKMPHTSGIIPGGATANPTAAQITSALELVDRITRFVNGRFASDLLAVSQVFPAYETIGAAGCGLLSNGAFPMAGGSLLFPAGVAEAGNISYDSTKIRESVASSWYTESTPLPPAEGVTIPDMNRSGAYSWSKAPRLDGAVFEVGPLARAVVAGTDPGGRGVWARYRARRQESSLIAEKMAVWLNALEAGKPGIEKLPDVPASGTGQGLSEAPRGSLGHWLTIEGGRISRYHVISPTTWNGSPRDEQGQPGAMERSLKGVSIADPKDPIEALRVIHSFDPCLQCAVH